MTDAPLIFLSYARPDRTRVMPFFDRLTSKGFDVWLDCKKLVAGQDWNYEIRRALDKAAVIVVFLSKNSIDRRGYVQREIRLSLEKSEEKLISDIYIIPVVLDEGIQIPDRIKNIHCVIASEEDSYTHVEDAIRHQLGVIGDEVRAVQDRANINWRQTTYKESWEGLPGYEVEYTLMHFSSEEYQHITDISVILHGRLTEMVTRQREAKLEQSSDMNFGQRRWSRMNTFSAYCSEPFVVGEIISIRYNIHWYGAGAAHPNMNFKTFSFLLCSVTEIHELMTIFRFDSREGALNAIRIAARKKLIETLADGDPESNYVDIDWINGGTESWENFAAFIFKGDGIEFLFAPYNVACYAAGPHSVNVAYDDIISFMDELYVCALGIQHILWKQKNAKILDSTSTG